MTIRGRMLVVFIAFALVAIGLTTLAAVVVGRSLSTEYALESSHSAKEQLGRSLQLRYDAFERASKLSESFPQVRMAATYRDKADWGFASPEEDRARRAALHADLADAPWDWTGVAVGGFFGVTDYKGRVVFTGSSPQLWDIDVSRFGPIAEAYLADNEFHGAAIVTSTDPQLVASGLLPPTQSKCFVVFARATAPTDVASAAFVQGTPTDALLEDVKLPDGGTQLVLIGPDGPCTGAVPSAVRDAGLALADQDPAVEVRAEGARWLVQRSPLLSLDDKTSIGTLLVARNLDVGLAVLDQAPTYLGVGALVILGLAVAAGWFVADRVTRPVTELEQAARAVAGGDLAVTVPVRSDDEIGHLASAFNQMTEGLRERDRIRTTFKKYMASDVVDYLLTHPDAQALGGDRRFLSVLFSDLVGFTTLSESLEPEAVIALLNEYFTEVSRRIVQRSGTIDKYLGDAVMAFFGAPVPRDDHAASACLAALDHLAALEVLRTRWAVEGRAPLSVRVGVNTGEVVIGNIGGEYGQDYTVIGDNVNLASRLEAVNKEYGTKILVSEATWLAARDVVAGREIDWVRVKGKTKPVGIYEIVAEAGNLSSAQVAVHEAFAQGLAHYRERQFPLAVASFTQALAVEADDGPSRVFLERANVFAAHPPPEEWAGVHILATK